MILFLIICQQPSCVTNDFINMCIGLPKIYRMGKKALCGGLHQIGHYEAEHEEMVLHAQRVGWTIIV